MRVLAFRHVPFEGLGLIEDALRRGGIDYACVDLSVPGTPPPDVASAGGLIFMGGPMSANDGFPWLRLEEEFIRHAVAAGKPVLGVCLGAQLVARALGARVYRNPQKEIGWFDIRWTDEAAGDALFHGLPPAETVFHWHGETFDLPEGAVRLASSDRCLNQAFRAGRNAYGLQFHLEVTPAIVADWCGQDANCGDVRELEQPLDPGANAARLADLSATVFGRWCELLRHLA